MKIKNILTLVLTLAVSIIILLDYMIAVKTIVNISDNSPIIVVSNNDSDSKVSTTELAKDEKITQPRGTVTSRSGKHESLQSNSDSVITESSESEATAPEVTVNEEINAENSIITEEHSPVQVSNTEIVDEDEAPEEVAPEEKPTFEGVELEYSAAYNISSARLTKSKGVTHYNGHKETYYSQRVLPGKGLKALNNNGRHVADDGTVRDGDGYIAIACNYLPKGSEIMTSLGPGKVYDTGGMTGQWIDIYVNW
ncbi:MAG: hypothetical protein IKF83_01580 [Clostridia bacterium]|nr:hypothetical protein [Clostridia bacterium]